MVLLCLGHCCCPSCVMHLQTAKGVKAKHPTAEEIQDLLRRVWDVIKSRPEWQPLLKAGKYPIYSLDNAAVHLKAVRDWNDLRYGWRLVRDQHGAVLHDAAGQIVSPMGSLLHLPPRSPDLHQLIEHAHAAVCKLLRLELDKLVQAGQELSPFFTLRGMTALLEHCFRCACPVQVVRAGLGKLLKCYQRVVQMHGFYPEAKFR